MDMQVQFDTGQVGTTQHYFPHHQHCLFCKEQVLLGGWVVLQLLQTRYNKLFLRSEPTNGVTAMVALDKVEAILPSRLLYRQKMSISTPLCSLAESPFRTKSLLPLCGLH